MLSERRLLHRKITYAQAVSDESNILHKLAYWGLRHRFFADLSKKKDLIEGAVAHHLGLLPKACHISDDCDWVHGTFNVCIPILIDDLRGATRVLLRLPLPFRVGEQFRPGNADEKLRCEAGAYAWLQQNCPNVPIPKLYGFALSSGQTFTHLANLPLGTRCIKALYRGILTLFRYSSPYLRHDNQSRFSTALGIGYLLIEYVEHEQGTMLSCTWEEKRKDPVMRKNLYRGLCRVLAETTRSPLPRIGSLIIDDWGCLRLENRPLTLEVQDLENEKIPVDMPRTLTYSSVDSYVNDILEFHDCRLRHQPNAVNNDRDCIYQISALTMMRSVRPLFMRRDLRHGPFFFLFGDLHQSNIFVDEKWNLKFIIDLEWACSRPVEMIQPPRWLTDEPVDQMDADAYDTARREFMGILEEVEMEYNDHIGTKLSSIMERGWELGTFWYTLALRSPTGLCRLFYDHIQPKLVQGHEDDPAFFRIVMYYWTRNLSSFVESKVKDKAKYDLQLREAFEVDVH